MVYERTTAGEHAFARWAMGWVRRPALAAAGFDPGVLYMCATPNAVVNGMFRGVPQDRGLGGRPPARRRAGGRRVRVAPWRVSTCREQVEHGLGRGGRGGHGAVPRTAGQADHTLALPCHL